jgi:toxin CcdB
MARFDVYANRSGEGFLLDVQADLIQKLNTRVVVPLISLDAAPAVADRLNPLFNVQGIQVSMLTQFIAAVPSTELTSLVASLDSESDSIFSAIDFLHHGW